MNVVLEDFQREVGPLEDQSWDRTSVREFEFLIVRACLGCAADSGRI
jgi:hypothetical protein